MDSCSFFRFFRPLFLANRVPGNASVTGLPGEKAAHYYQKDDQGSSSPWRPAGGDDLPCGAVVW
jgi:hypothetical protein